MRSQTSTEYLIILAVVILISVLVIGVLGGIPTVGGGSADRVEILDAATQDIGINSFSATSAGYFFDIVNNQVREVQIDNVTVNGVVLGLTGYQFPYLMDSGESLLAKVVATDSPAIVSIAINYTILDTGASYIQEHSFTPASFDQHISDDLFGFWNFDAGNATHSFDATSYGEHGRLMNGATIGTGKSGQGLVLDGTDDFLNITDNGVSTDYNYFTPSSYTVSLWLQPDSLGRWHGLYSKDIFDDEASNEGIHLLIDTSNYAKVGDGGNSGPDYNTLDTISSGWTHLVFIFCNAATDSDACDFSSRVVYYFNGVQQRNSSHSSFGSQTVGEVFIGRAADDGSTGRYTQGTIDEVMIWQRALTLQEIQDLYTIGS